MHLSIDFSLLNAHTSALVKAKSEASRGKSARVAMERVVLNATGGRRLGSPGAEDEVQRRLKATGFASAISPASSSGSSSSSRKKKTSESDMQRIARERRGVEKAREKFLAMQGKKNREEMRKVTQGQHVKTLGSQRNYDYWRTAMKDPSTKRSKPMPPLPSTSASSSSSSSRTRSAKRESVLMDAEGTAHMKVSIASFSPRSAPSPPQSGTSSHPSSSSATSHKSASLTTRRRSSTTRDTPHTAANVRLGDNDDDGSSSQCSSTASPEQQHQLHYHADDNVEKEEEEHTWTASPGASVAGLVNGGGEILGSSSLRDNDCSGMGNGEGDDTEENALSPVTTSVSVSALSAMEDVEEEEDCVGAEDVQIDGLVNEKYHQQHEEVEERSGGASPVHQNGNASTIQIEAGDTKKGNHALQTDDADAQNAVTVVSSPSAASEAAPPPLPPTTTTTTTTTAGSAIAASLCDREDADASVTTAAIHDESEEARTAQEQPEPHPRTLDTMKIGGGIGKSGIGKRMASPSAPAASKYTPTAAADRDGHHAREGKQKSGFFCCFGL